MRFTKSLFLSAAALIAPLAMQAGTVNLSTTGSVSLADGILNFSNISCTYHSTGQVAMPASCAAATATALSTPLPGIEFGASNFLASDGSSVDLTIHYTVTVAPGDGAITSVGLNYAPFFAGMAVSSVTETIDDMNNNQVGQTFVCDGAADLGCANTITSTTIGLQNPNGYTTLYVTKDINLTTISGNAPASSQFSYVDQTFTLNAAPEPGATALMGAGLGLLGLLVRRRAVK